MGNTINSNCKECNRKNINLSCETETQLVCNNKELGVITYILKIKIPMCG